MWSGQEPPTVVRVLLLIGIVARVIGLKFTRQPGSVVPLGFLIVLAAGRVSGAILAGG